MKRDKITLAHIWRITVAECGESLTWDTSVRLHKVAHARAVFVGLCLSAFGVRRAQIVRMLEATPGAVYCAAYRWDAYPKEYKQKLIQRLDKKLTMKVKNDPTAISPPIHG